MKDLRKQVTALEDDLRVQSEEVPRFADALRAEYDLARQAERTAATYGAWRDERVTQVAAAWVLGTVFVRFCEDNQLIEWPFIAGPGERLADAEERHEAFFRAHPSLNDRDWIVEAFNHLASTHPAVAGLFDRDHNPLWEIEPSFEAATELLRFWRRREGRYDFTDPSLDTRFLGDLYQDLSEHARKTYALLQTPEFVEEFILDLTLEPAIQEFGLKGLRTIDPACGSGHFLLGIFARLIDKWRAEEPGMDDWTLIRRSMESVHGCDKNPFAASIARFRLLVAAMKQSKEGLLMKAAVFPVNVAVGDSLLHGDGAPGVQTSIQVRDGILVEPSQHAYRTEDVHEYGAQARLLSRGTYHVVVGNPPYITPKDKQENENYRDGYDACSGTYALSVPFAQCLFQLAIRKDGSAQDAGYVGQITANSFMKREFGKKLVEKFFQDVHITHVIDTSGAYIPGHGTPTVILVGRNHPSRRNASIRVVAGIRGEPAQPTNPSEGVVWAAITAQVGRSGSVSAWVSSSDMERSLLARHPWTLSSGESARVVELLEYRSTRLKAIVSSIGYTGQTNSDDSFLYPTSFLARKGVGSEFIRDFLTGTEVRDYGARPTVSAVFPYDAKGRLRQVVESASLTRLMWPNRTVLGARATFGGGTYRSEGRPWWGWHQVAKSRLNGPVLTWPLVQTHQHFAYLSNCFLHNRHAPVIKLHDSASEADYTALLGVMNSSAACFWLKQVCHGKGNGGVNEGLRGEEWEEFFEFAGTKLHNFPLPRELPLELGRRLHAMSEILSDSEPLAVMAADVPARDNISLAEKRYGQTWRQMIAIQEELDWHVYSSFGLINCNEVASLVAVELDDIPQINPGERAFEIVLARKAIAGEVGTAWFDRHRFAPVTEVPAHWPQRYREIVQARIDYIGDRSEIAHIERPEYKRRWASQSWGKKEAEALRAWLLNRCEKADLWFGRRDGVKQPRTLTVSQLADQFNDDADMQSVAQFYATDHLKKRDLTLAQILEQVLADQHVPYLAALRYKDSGLRKRHQWEETWELQREEDRTGRRLDIAVPPKYTSADFKKTTYWAQRGKLDVPKERFISYLDANPDSDPTLLLGWAGWDHKDQAQALVNIINDRTEQAGWGTDKIQPLLAGLLELMPWVKQWHGEYDDEWGGNPAEEYQAFLDGQRAKHQLTEEDLRGWRPAATTRGRKKG